MSSLDALRGVLAPFDPIVLCATDPGAFHAMASIHAGLHGEHCFLWVREGWAADQAGPGMALEQIDLRGRPLALFGPRMDFAATRAALHTCRRRGITSAFLYDHWSPHFWLHHFLGPDDTLEVLPDLLLTLDDPARETLIGMLAPYLGSKIGPVVARIRVIGQPSVEDKAARIRALGEDALAVIRGQVAGGRRYDLLLLEPIAADLGRDAAGMPDIGYDEFFFLRDIPQWLEPPTGLALIRPHPRHDLAEIAAFLDGCWTGQDYRIDQRSAIDDLIAGAERVFGMTTVALIIALKAGRPTFSYQVGRNARGLLFTNRWLEGCLLPSFSTPGIAP